MNKSTQKLADRRRYKRCVGTDRSYWHWNAERVVINRAEGIALRGTKVQVLGYLRRHLRRGTLCDLMHYTDSCLPAGQRVLIVDGESCMLSQAGAALEAEGNAELARLGIAIDER